MSAREAEARMLARCVQVVRGELHCADDRREACTFRLAAMVLQSRQPDFSEQLMHASELYFEQHAELLLSGEELMRLGVIESLPRLRDMLSRQLDLG